MINDYIAIVLFVKVYVSRPKVMSYIDPKLVFKASIYCKEN